MVKLSVALLVVMLLGLAALSAQAVGSCDGSIRFNKCKFPTDDPAARAALRNFKRSSSDKRGTPVRFEFHNKHSDETPIVISDGFAPAPPFFSECEYSLFSLVRGRTGRRLRDRESLHKVRDFEVYSDVLPRSGILQAR